MARSLFGCLVGCVCLVATLPACDAVGRAGTDPGVATLAATSPPPPGVPATWRRVAENSDLPGGYRLVWRYEAPGGRYAGTAQLIRFESGLDRSQLLNVAGKVLALSHHDAYFGARAITDSQGRQGGFAFHASDDGPPPLDAQRTPRFISGMIWLSEQDGKGEALEMFRDGLQPGTLSEEQMMAVGKQWLQ